MAGLFGRWTVGGFWLSLVMEATTATAALGDLDAPADVLAFARERRALAERAEAELLQAAVVWAAQHPAESLEAAEVLRTTGYAGGFGDTAVPVAGPGAPLVAEFSVAEFAAAVGLSTEAANSATENSATSGAPGPATGTAVSPNPPA